jgi:Mn-dependent DtxR family transcriptional regulator
MSIRTVAEPATGSITDLQGQYLAFIYAYSKIHRAPPAEADFQRFFEVSPPSVHRMVLELERKGLIRRQPGRARSIELLAAVDSLPILR